MGWGFKTEVLNLNLKLKFKTKFYSLTRSLASHCPHAQVLPIDNPGRDKRPGLMNTPDM